jgi:hypothetical protein
MKRIPPFEKKRRRSPEIIWRPPQEPSILKVRYRLYAVRHDNFALRVTAALDRHAFDPRRL